MKRVDGYHRIKGTVKVHVERAHLLPFDSRVADLEIFLNKDVNRLDFRDMVNWEKENAAVADIEQAACTRGLMRSTHFHKLVKLKLVLLSLVRFVISKEFLILGDRFFVLCICCHLLYRPSLRSTINLGLCLTSS